MPIGGSRLYRRRCAPAQGSQSRTRGRTDLDADTSACCGDPGRGRKRRTWASRWTADEGLPLTPAPATTAGGGLEIE
jgi:hypothetical protein